MKRLALLLALCATGVEANDDFPSLPPIDFALRLSHHRIDLDYAGTTIDTKADRAAFHWQERYGDDFQLGLIAGVTSLSQSNNLVTAGQELKGYHIGVSFDVTFVRTNRFDGFVNGDWLYQRVDHEDAQQQRVVLVTREPNLRAGVGFLVAPSVRFYAGARYGDVSGEQRLSGPVNETRRIQTNDEAGGFGGIELRLSDDGYIRLDAETGSDRRVSLSLGRRY